MAALNDQTGVLKTLVVLFVLAWSSLAHAADREAPVIEHQAIKEAPLYEAIEFRVQINDASMIFAPSLYYRYVGQPEYRMLEMKETSRAYVATIAGSEVTGDIEYFLEAFDEHGNGPARTGHPQQPFRIAVGKITPAIPSVAVPTPPIKKPSPLVELSKPKLIPIERPKLVQDNSTKTAGLHTRWWFWTTLTIALVAGGTAAAWALQPVESESVSVRVIGPDPYRGLP